ncbi:MAG: hypothetical protein HYZ90_02575 [Candidatus Omnitrophica bacterium]|nr:hypothetical protein [Candidatus Omnitrophota bacterium]
MTRKAASALLVLTLVVAGPLPASAAPGHDTLRELSAREGPAEAGLEESLRGQQTGLSRRQVLRTGALGLGGLFLRDALGFLPPQADFLADLRRGFEARYAAYRQAAGEFVRARKIVNRQPMKSAVPRLLQEGKISPEVLRAYRARAGREFEWFDFNGLYEEYAPGEVDKGLTEYGRVWIYGNALVLYDLVMKGDSKEARSLAEALVRLGQQEEALGTKSVYHFSYSTQGDPFMDPRSPTGNTLWALSALYAYMLQANDFRHLPWINRKLQELLQDLQVADPVHPAYGFIQAMRYQAKLDDRPLDEVGYEVYRGNFNKPADFFATEHQFDLARVLWRAYLANEKNPDGPNFLDFIVFRNKILMEALPKLWDKDHFVTGIDAQGRFILGSDGLPSLAADNNSWAGLILSYNEEMAWQAIQFSKRQFLVRQRVELMDGVPEAIKVRQAGESVGGLSFFDEHFLDEFVRRDLALIPPEKVLEIRQRWAQMIQPEATFGFIDFLFRFADETRHPDRRRQAQDLGKELLEGMLRLHELYGRRGLPYATVNTLYFTTLQSTTATVTGQMVFRRLFEGVGGLNFLLVDPPPAMRQGITLRIPRSGLEEANARLWEVLKRMDRLVLPYHQAAPLAFWIAQPQRLGSEGVYFDVEPGAAYAELELESLEGRALVVGQPRRVVVKTRELRHGEEPFRGIPAENEFADKLADGIDQIRRNIEAVQPRVSAGAIFIGLTSTEPAPRRRGFVDDWAVVRHIQRARNLNVILTREELSPGEDSIDRALAIAQHFADRGFQGNVGIALGVVSRRQAPDLGAVEKALEAIHRKHLGLTVSFIYTLEEELNEVQQVQFRRPVPSYAEWFAAWAADPIGGLMAVMPRVLLPMELWQEFERGLNTLAGLEQAA